VVRCEKIDLVGGTGSTNNSDNTFGTEVSVSCNDGYKIAGNTSLVVNCTANGTWTLEPVSCERKLRCNSFDVTENYSLGHRRRLVFFSFGTK